MRAIYAKSLSNVDFNRIAEAQARATRSGQRKISRFVRSLGYAAAGLNGKRAVARRLRQIESGRLGWANGLEPVLVQLHPEMTKSERMRALGFAP